MDLSEFEIIRKIGEGGFGEVFLAVPKGLKKPDDIPKYAVKMLKQHYCLTPKIVRHFVKEAKALSELDDPCVLKVLHSGMEGERPYYISRYYDKSLVDLLEEDLPLDTIMNISYDLLSALKYIEGRFVHRDVKPSNILIHDKKHAVLADFGICIDERKGLTTPDNMLDGTIEYMAPERLISAGDNRSDIYSAGAVIYEMFVKKSHKALHKGKVIAPSEAYHGISAGFDRVIFRSLEADVKDRYQSAEDMRSALTLEYSRLTGTEPMIASDHNPPGKGIPSKKYVALDKPQPAKEIVPVKKPEPMPVVYKAHVKKKSRLWLAAAAAILPVIAIGSAYYLNFRNEPQTGVDGMQSHNRGYISVTAQDPIYPPMVVRPSSTPSSSPTESPTKVLTLASTHTATSTFTPSVAPTLSPTRVPSDTYTPTATCTSTSTPTYSLTATSTNTSTPTPKPETSTKVPTPRSATLIPKPSDQNREKKDVYDLDIGGSHLRAEKTDDGYRLSKITPTMIPVDGPFYTKYNFLDNEDRELNEMMTITANAFNRGRSVPSPYLSRAFTVLKSVHKLNWCFSTNQPIQTKLNDKTIDAASNCYWIKFFADSGIDYHAQKLIYNIRNSKLYDSRGFLRHRIPNNDLPTNEFLASDQCLWGIAIYAAGYQEEAKDLVKKLKESSFYIEPYLKYASLNSWLEAKSSCLWAMLLAKTGDKDDAKRVIISLKDSPLYIDGLLVSLSGFDGSDRVKTYSILDNCLFGLAHLAVDDYQGALEVEQNIEKLGHVHVKRLGYILKEDGLVGDAYSKLSYSDCRFGICTATNSLWAIFLDSLNPSAIAPGRVLDSLAASNLLRTDGLVYESSNAEQNDVVNDICAENNALWAMALLDVADPKNLFLGD